MRSAQGLPVNMIVLTALALLVLVVVGAFFISGFGQAGGSVNIVEADQSACNGRCQSMVASGFSLPTCSDVESLGAYTNADSTGFADMGCATAFGPCYVTVQGGVTCTCDDTECTEGGGGGGGADLCAGVTCPDTCVGDTAYQSGACDPATGQCDYATTIDCTLTGQVCDAGACVAAP